MVGRKEELKYFKSLLNEEESQFVAVFGRRRIGKTYLIRESFEYKFTFEHTGISNVTTDASCQRQAQLDKFLESLNRYGYFNDEKITNWNQAFNCLKQIIERSNDKKKIIFIDELSWMDTKNSDLISALESFWNGWVMSRKEKDVILIVCASATYWMTENIVNAKGGLHNRLTGQIYLKPFTLRECEEYLKTKNINFNRHQILQCYMILGGVPYYWSLLKKGKSLPQNVDDLFFKDNALLKNEFENLYRALFNKPDQYIKIIEILSESNNGITRDEIISRSGIPGSGDLSKKLEELENCGFVRKYIPFGYKQKNYIYQLMDNFTLFYYKFIKDNVYDDNYWQNQINSPKVKAWSGLAFEKICLEHIAEIKKALGISGVYTEVNGWSCKKDLDKGIFGSQIDLLIVRKDQIINLCEMKYSETDYIVDLDFDKSMKKKISDFMNITKTKYAIHPTLITTYDVIENSYSKEIQSIIKSDDLF